VVYVGKSFPERIVEVYIGEYASGKSENAVNRALELKNAGRQVTLVDLDLVEPFYTLRFIKRELEEQGVNVIAWKTEATKGLGEAGCLLLPAMRWVLWREGDIIIDVGYGVQGTQVLNLVEKYEEDPDIKVLAIINIARPLTSTLDDILAYLQKLERVDGLINNSHLGEDTTIDIVLNGEKIVRKVGEMLGIPVVATTVEKTFRGKMPKVVDRNIPIRYLTRYMQNSFW
jgi:hypothetical protein